MIAGETILKAVRQELTYSELDSSIGNLWNVLVTTGYLTYRGEPEEGKYQLTIPNLGVKKIFVTQIQEWFEETVSRDPHRLGAFCKAFKEGDAKAAEVQFQAYLVQTISIRALYRRGKRKTFIMVYASAF